MSHHNSGPRAHALPVGDITDLYAFPAPDGSGHLVLVLDTLPFAAPDQLGSDALVYRFRLRPVAVAPDQPALFAVQEPEVTIDVTFEPGEHGDAGPHQRGTCTTSTGEQVTFRVGDESPPATAGLRAFAGPRWNPFFSDANALVSTITTGELAFDAAHGAILGDGKNVFSVVVEIDAASFGLDGLVGVVGETVIDGSIPMRWERCGRPELENAILGMKQYDRVNRDLEIRDLFNAEDAFALGADYVSAYRARLDANLAFWDGLDGRVDWPLDADGTHPLTELLLADFLVVDVSQPYGEDTFLEIESAVLQGRPHRTCGGRSPNDDSMDTLYTLLVNAGRGPHIEDGVDAASRPAGRQFPYLRPPNLDPPEHTAH